MDNYKLQLLRERDDVWVEARESLPLFEKFFAEDITQEEDADIGWISIKLIATELFAYKEIDKLKNKIIKVGKEEETKEVRD